MFVFPWLAESFGGVERAWGRGGAVASVVVGGSY